MYCIICDQSTCLFQHPKFKTSYHRCSTCGFISKDSKDHVSSEEEFKIYEYHENSIEDEGYVAFFEKFLHTAVFPFTNGGKQAFDFGSGPAPVLAQLMERDYRYECTIYDKFYAPKKTYLDKTFDLITSTEVMEHISDPFPVFEELRDLLKDDGILSVMTLFPPDEYDTFFNWHYMRDETHISFYTSKAMEIIADKIGLSIVYCDNSRYTSFKKK